MQGLSDWPARFQLEVSGGHSASLKQPQIIALGPELAVPNNIFPVLNNGIWIMQAY